MSHKLLLMKDICYINSINRLNIKPKLLINGLNKFKK